VDTVLPRFAAGRGRRPVAGLVARLACLAGLVAGVALTACDGTSTPPTPPAPPRRTTTVAAPAAVDQRVEPPLPEPRQEVAAAASDALGLWVIGGFTGAGVSSPSVFHFDGSRWRAESALPLGLDHPAAAVLDATVYVAGGNNNGRAGRRVFALPGPRELPPLNHARAGLALIATAGHLYAIGGNDQNENVAPAEEYDPASRRWRVLPALPHPRNHVAGFTYHGLACVAGGRSPNTTAVDCWNPAAGRWIRLPYLPAPTSGAGGGTLDGRPYVAGGEDPSAGTIVDQIAVLTGKSWSMSRMLQPRHGIALAAYQGRLWACGGGTRAGIGTVAACTSIR
jgi:serine/threonine-protein kinase PknK